MPDPLPPIDGVAGAPAPADTPSTVPLIDPQGIARDVPAEYASALLARNWRPQTHEDVLAAADRTATEATYGGVGGAVKAGAAAVARGATLGISDLALRGLGGEDAAFDLTSLKQAHPVISTAGEIAGAVAPALLSGGASLPSSLAARAGAGVAERLGGGLLAHAVGGAVEGAIYGTGQGVSDLALSSDPLTVEHVTSSLSSNMLYGGAIGGAAGLAGAALERGLQRAKGAIDARIASPVAEDLTPDLAALDKKGLAAAREAEVSAIETQRVPEKQQLIEDVQDYRERSRDVRLFEATKGVADRDAREAGASLYRADKALRNALDVKAQLVENPERMLGVLQRQEQALSRIKDWGQQEATAFDAAVTNAPERIRSEIMMGEVHGEIGPFTPDGLDLAVERELKRRKAIDWTGAKNDGLGWPKQLDIIETMYPGAIEKNREFQRRIAELTADPASDRLAQIDTASEALSAPREKSLGATVLHAIPFAGRMADIAEASGRAMGGLREAGAKAAKRVGAAASSFLGAAAKGASAVGPLLPMAATKILSTVRYAPDAAPASSSAAPAKTNAKPPTLDAAYKARTAEIKSQTAYDTTGVPRLRPEARAAMAERLKPIRATNPILADRMETLATRRIEYLSSLIPRRPEIAGVQVGPDHWQPSDMEMRGFARSAAAVEDPLAVLERATHGSVTPEDAGALRAVYPEMLADFTTRVAGELPALRHSLPIARQTALSILTGTPVNPAMDPAIMSVLQAQFQYEPGPAPTAQPQFGSVRNRAEIGTASQRREEGNA
jgi:hypothetical protein